MRSCKYLKVSGKHRTKTLCLNNLQFFCNKREMQHDHPELHLADCVSITFVFQKKDERDATVTQPHTLDSLLCLVKAWATVICRLLSYGCSPSTQVNVIHLANENLSTSPPNRSLIVCEPWSNSLGRQSWDIHLPTLVHILSGPEWQ